MLLFHVPFNDWCLKTRRVNAASLYLHACACICLPVRIPVPHANWAALLRSMPVKLSSRAGAWAPDPGEQVFYRARTGLWQPAVTLAPSSRTIKVRFTLTRSDRVVFVDPEKVHPYERRVLCQPVPREGPRSVGPFANRRDMNHTRRHTTRR